MDYMKSSDASKRHMEFSAEISIFIRFLLYVQLFNFNCIESTYTLLLEKKQKTHRAW